MRPLMAPWFETSTLPFSRFMHPWFRYDLMEELERSWEDYNNYFERFISDLPSLRRVTMDVSCDIADKADRFVLTADLPGMAKDEVTINVIDNEIEISAEHKEAVEEKEKGYIRKERSETRYYRRLSLPEEIVSSKVTAKMTNGVLTVELPKKTPTKVEQPVAIKIQ
jgi:HSP20 family protein